MVVSAMLGGLALGTMHLVKNMQQAQNNAQSSADEIELKSSIRMLLEDERFCRVSLAGDGAPGFPVDPITFFKKNIDEDDEGLDLSLYLSDQVGTNRTLKKFNGANNKGTEDKSKFGNLTIKTIKLIMNNGVGSNYANSPAHSDVGIVRVKVEKGAPNAQKRELIFDFDLNVKMATGQSPESNGKTRILGCGLSGGGASTGLIEETSTVEIRLNPDTATLTHYNNMQWGKYGSTGPNCCGGNMYTYHKMINPTSEPKLVGKTHCFLGRKSEFFIGPNQHVSVDCKILNNGGASAKQLSIHVTMDRPMIKYFHGGYGMEEFICEWTCIKVKN